MVSFRSALMSVFLALALSAFGATLQPGSWHEPVRDALQRMIDRHANDPDAYAVFDFDNTCAVGDCEHAALGYMIDNLAFAFSPDELPVLFLEGMPDPDRPLEPGKERATARNVVADCADLYRELLEMKSRRSMEEVRKTDAFAAFAAKMRYLRKRISRTFVHASVLWDFAKNHHVPYKLCRLLFLNSHIPPWNNHIYSHVPLWLLL